MRVLMFAWEYPPLITGGLGMACAGMTEALGRAGHEVLLVLPDGRQGSATPNVRLIGASCILGISFFSLISRVHSYGGICPQSDSSFASKGGVDETGFSHVLSAYSPSACRDDYCQMAVNAYGSTGKVLALRETFDLIHCHDWMSIPAGLEAKRASGKPLILHVHSLEIDRCGENPSSHVRKWEHAGLIAADRVIAVSEFSRGRIMAEYAIPQEKISVVHNAVHAAKGVKHPGRANNAGQQSVLFFGRMTWQKGPRHFLDAAALVHKKLHSVRFVMAGDGDLLHEMRRYAGELNLTKVVEFPGFLSREEVSRVMAASDVFVMPSMSEPFGIVALEAAAAGLPVILSSSCGVREVLTDAVTVPTGDAAALADSIVELLTHPEQCTASGERNRLRVTDITWAHVAEQLGGIYEDVCSTMSD